MLFNSIEFLLFLVVVVCCYFLVAHRWRWVLLLVANYYFYMSWKPEFALLILLSTIVSFYGALFIQRTKTKQKKQRGLRIVLVVNVGILLFYKYANFLGESLQLLIDMVAMDIQLPYVHIILPIGISFYTFQVISYVVDVYKGDIEPEKHLGIFATYISFFPQLVAGPIERAAHLLPQFREKHRFLRDNIRDGLQLMIWGMFQKVVVADRIALLINPVFADVHDYTGIGLLIAIFLFGIQIYGDFAGYTNIARGAAKMMGFDLMKNFNRPYFAHSVTEFWRRWHISLSTWLRDYIYIPLGGNRVSQVKWVRNIMWTFLISGLRHGANWTFVVWGGIHGLAIVCEKFFSWEKRSSYRNGVYAGLIRVVQILFIFLLVQACWVFFRVESFGDAWYMLTHMFSSFRLPSAWSGWGPMGAEFRLVVLFILLLWGKEYGEEYLSSLLVGKKKVWIGLVWYVVLTIFILVFLMKGQQDFIYFQF